jgi:hypothetical protein
MPAMNQPMLLLLAPLSLLTGAALQILVSRFCSSRSKGVLAVLSCLPAVCAVLVTLAQLPRLAEQDPLFAWG